MSLETVGWRFKAKAKQPAGIFFGVSGSDLEKEINYVLTKRMVEALRDQAYVDGLNPREVGVKDIGPEHREMIEVERSSAIQREWNRRAAT